MIIREGTISDVKKISRLWAKMCQEVQNNTSPDVESWRKVYSEKISDKDFVFLVAEEGGRLIGFLSALAYRNTETGKKHGKAMHFYVEPEFRGTDISQKLYSGIIEEARKRICSIYEHECDESTKDFWIKKGYKVSKFLMSKEV